MVMKLKRVYSLSYCGLYALLLVVPALCLSCGKGDGLVRGAVHGKVQFDNQPVEEGSISFTPIGGATGPMAGGSITAGEYSIPLNQGPVVGKHIVSIEARRKTGRQYPAMPPAPPGEMIDEVKQYIPYRYNARSVLRTEITEGDNEVDFLDLTSK